MTLQQIAQGYYDDIQRDLQLEGMAMAGDIRYFLEDWLITDPRFIEQFGLTLCDAIDRIPCHAVRVASHRGDRRPRDRHATAMAQCVKREGRVQQSRSQSQISPSASYSHSSMY